MAEAPVPPAFPAGTLGAAWTAAYGGDGAKLPESEAAPTMEDVRHFVAELERYTPEWAQLFQHIPADARNRKDALGGAVKLRTLGKRLEALASQASGKEAAKEGEAAGEAAFDAAADAVAPAADADALAAAGEEAPAAESPAPGDAGDGSGRQHADVLAECQKVFRDIALAFLEVTFAVDETITKERFPDQAAVYEARDRLRTVCGLTRGLAGLFARHGVDPKSTVPKREDGDQSVSPEMMKMLEKCMEEKKGSAVAVSEEIKAARAAWERGDGLCSAMLGEEIWEAVNWRRAIFLFSYINAQLARKEQGSGEGPSDDVFDESIRCFDLMLHAQGPIASDRDDPAIWQADSDGQHEEETARMFYHGVYSSSHLRGLKFLAELCFLKWEHKGKKRVDAEVAAVVNRKFVHVVRHIIPGAGWTADVEYDRVLQVEKALETTVYSQGLDVKPTPPAAGKGKTGDGAAQSGKKKKGSKKK